MGPSFAPCMRAFARQGMRAAYPHTGRTPSDWLYLAIACGWGKRRASEGGDAGYSVTRDPRAAHGASEHRSAGERRGAHEGSRSHRARRYAGSYTIAKLAPKELCTSAGRSSLS